jgi:phage/plasmid-like protein (TIGR03299 family)
MYQHPNQLFDNIESQSIASYRPSPWRTIGQVVDRPLDSGDAIQLAGLDWQVQSKQLYTADLDAVPNHVAMVRSDTGNVIGVVGTAFEPVQNHELFAFLRSLAGTAPITIDSAGCFNAGAIVWVLARIADLDIRIGEDLSRGYMLAVTAHDSSRSVTLVPTTLRITCMNSLRMVDAQMRRSHGKPRLQAGYRLRHTKNVHRAIEEVAAAYRNTRSAHQATKDAYEFLASRPMTEAMVKAMFERVFSRDGSSEADRAKSIREAREHKLRTILASPGSSRHRG